MPTLVSGKLEPVDEDEEHVGEKESSMAMRRTRNVHRLGRRMREAKSHERSGESWLARARKNRPA